MVGAMPVNLIPKFCNGTMDSHNGTDDSEFQVHIGSRIKSNDDFGTVKYIGEVQGYKGIWYGVEWDDPARGKHDGSVEDVQYFKTSKPGAGSFIRTNKIAPFRTCAEAIRKYYGDREDETVAAHRRTVINEWKREMGAPFIEMVGFEKIHQKQKFDRLLEVCVHDQNVFKAGDVATLCPNVRSIDVSRNLFSSWREVIQLSAQLPDLRELDVSIDVSRNLFSSWREVIQLSAQLPDLRELDVSKNRMAIDMPEETLIQQSFAFANLEKLNISVCDYEWSDLLALSHLWPNVQEVIAAYNRIKSITPAVCDYEWSDLLALSHLWPNVQEVIAAYNRIKSITPAVTTLRSLTILRLDGNPIDSWYEVMNLGRLKNLRVLSLNDCRIQEIRLSDDPENKVDIFENLETLFLNRNMIKDWRSISELDKLKKLKRLYFLKNPIQNTEDYDTGSQLIIAKIGTLQELNGSTITRELRRGAEYDYMKRAGADWKQAQNDPALKLAFQLEHCRFEQLINKYGIPEDSLLVKQTKTSTLTSQLLEITLRDDTGKSFKKKFPATMAVQKLVTLAQRLFSKSGNTGTKLYLLDDQMNGAEIHLDNVMKDLAYFSIKNGDIIVVRFR